MSNFHEQNLRCIKFKISKEQAINTLCNTLCSSKTPEDIFDKTELLRVDRMYLPQYLFTIGFKYICEVGIYPTNNEGKRSGNTIYQDISGETRSLICKRATNEHLSFIPDKFFPELQYCLDNYSTEIELDFPDILVCSEDSISWEKVYDSLNYDIKTDMEKGVLSDVKNIVSERQIGYPNYNFYLTNEYKSEVSKKFDYTITDFAVCSMLIPVYKILFKYYEKTYTVYVNGCNVKKGLLSNNEVYCEDLPKDTTKTNGLFSKISYNKAKKLHKKENMETIKKIWIEKIGREE